MARGSSSTAMSARPSCKQQSDGGYLTSADLADYRVARRTPILWQHDGAIVALNPPPAASGALIAFGLGFMCRRLPTTAARSTRLR